MPIRPRKIKTMYKPYAHKVFHQGGLIKILKEVTWSFQTASALVDFTLKIYLPGSRLVY